MAESACLITVAVGRTYESFALQLQASATYHFKPTKATHFLILPGVAGWPAATLYRYHVLLKHAGVLQYDYLYLVDADMRCEQAIGPEILGDLVAVQHPGYVGCLARELPYERRPQSAAYVAPNHGSTYYAGGLLGGSRGIFLQFAKRMVNQIDADRARGLVAVWHDESHLNRCLIDEPPERVLSPAFCHPDQDSWYQSFWPEPYERILVALDKTPKERGRR